MLPICCNGVADLLYAVLVFSPSAVMIMPIYSIDVAYIPALVLAISVLVLPKYFCISVVWGLARESSIGTGVVPLCCVALGVVII